MIYGLSSQIRIIFTSLYILATWYIASHCPEVSDHIIFLVTNLNTSKFTINPCGQIEVFELISNLLNRKSPGCVEIFELVLKNVSPLIT